MNPIDSLVVTIARMCIRNRLGTLRSALQTMTMLPRWYGIFVVLLPALAAAGPASDFIFSCSPENDVFRALKASGLNPARHASPEAAVSAARPGSLVLLMAEEYPQKPLALSSNLFAEGKAKHLRLYVEFPDQVPGLSFAPARSTPWERFIVSSEHLGPELPKGRLLTAHDCKVRPVTVADPLVVVGRVAGYNDAVYGIPTNAQPVLFEFDDGRVLVATTKLSSFLTGRFAPRQEWDALWKFILRRLGAGSRVCLPWEPRVTTMPVPSRSFPRGRKASFRLRGAVALRLRLAHSGGSFRTD